MSEKKLTLASTQFFGEGDWDIVFEPPGMQSGKLYTDSLGGDTVKEVWQFPAGSEPGFVDARYDAVYVSAGGDAPQLPTGWRQAVMEIEPQNITGPVPTPGPGGNLFQASSIENGSVTGKAWLYRKNNNGTFTDSWCFQDSFKWGQPGVTIEVRPVPGDNATWAAKANNDCPGGQTAVTQFNITQ
ncbi:MAG: hypothetical protein VX899_10280 [Myxococcota bacterium]|nr:hypothetical protein [Myxococcota bacterium]